MTLKTVYSGIDTLVLGFKIKHFNLTERDIEMLTCEKILAGDQIFNTDGSPINLCGQDFHILPKGSRGYEWVLKNDDIEICIAKEAHDGMYYPELYVTFRAHFLAREGHVAAYQRVCNWINGWCTVSGNVVSRVDLCIDKQVPKMPEINIATEMFTRSSKTLHETANARGLHITGYTIGKGDVLGRSYDKTVEVLQSQKEWFFPIWEKNGWDGNQTICRTEFQARRNFLKQMSVDDFDSLCERTADMWRYFTYDWLTIRHEDKNDKNRGRWPIQDWWLDIQQGLELFGVPYGILRVKTRKARYEHLMKQAKGCLVAAAAQESAVFGIKPAVKRLKRNVEAEMDKQEFIQDIRDKISLVANMK